METLLETLQKSGLRLTQQRRAIGELLLHYDADTSPHDNLACTSCHHVIDLPSQYVNALDDEVSRNSGYQILGSRMRYYGLCPECQARIQAS